MLKAGITGGIGSGKTIVSRIFQSLNVPVYDSDTSAKILMDTDPVIREKLTQLFGEELYRHQKLDRPMLSRIIFNDPEKLEQVNRIVHPRVREHFNNWCNRQAHAKYILQEAAIIFESGAYRFLDKIVTITAPLELRIDRVMARNNLSREEVLKIVDRQIGEEERIKRSDYVISNDDKALVIPQVLAIHDELLNCADAI